MQDGTGLDVVRTLRKESDQVGLIVLTMHSGDEQIFAAMQAGASGFVGKDAPSTEVIKAARHAAVSPKAFVCAGLVGAMMRRQSAESTALTEREHDVLLLLAEGLNAAAIGQKALPQRVHDEVPHRPDLPEGWGRQPRPGPGHGDADRAAVDRPAVRALRPPGLRGPDHVHWLVRTD
ncbi:response regulator [Nocardioides convexus]|uniref:response regulator n=1 Tax=Nocardioides convexus TaxID=2712224 RepID=UPI00241884D3|nr:response regulator [Nocardioides convexus]